MNTFDIPLNFYFPAAADELSAVHAGTSLLSTSLGLPLLTLSHDEKYAAKLKGWVSGSKALVHTLSALGVKYVSLIQANNDEGI